MKCCFLILLLAYASLGFCQYDPAKVQKKAVQLYGKARDFAEGGTSNFPQAVTLLNQAVKIDSNYEEAFLTLGGIYQEQKNYHEAVAYYEKAKKIDSAFFLDYNLPYSICLAGEGEFNQALESIEKFLTISNLNETSRNNGEYRKKSYAFAVEYEKNKSHQDYKFEPQNLGDSINSPVSEYYPTLTIDGSKLIFTRRVNDTNEDFYESDLINGKWSKAKGLPGNINTSYNEAAQNISQDGQWLVFDGCDFPSGFGSCDIYISMFTPDGWSAAENLGKNVNTEFWEAAPSLSPDKKDLYFASRRPGGYGGSDIYVSHLLPSGAWSPAENLGPVINSAGDESTPFIHADNQTLYFTSNGLPGYGGDDLFVSRKDAKGNWTKPENLGYPINTIENEGTLIVAADGKTAYYASDRADSRGGLDLYTFQLRSDIRPSRTLWVKGKIFDKKTQKGLPSAVELIDLATKQVISKVQTNESGNYLVTLPVGKDYAFNVNRKGYLFFSDNFALSLAPPDSVYNIDIALQPIEINATIVLKNIFFDVAKYDLKPQSQVELDKVLQLLKENPSLKIEISGHTDNIGKDADNLLLSQNRARSVVNYLSANGIEIKRLSFKGFGQAQPVAENKTESGRAQNRRTELKVVGQ
jgi:outer membrane protein OmpA-like peptidoglycan-associated protein/tetratricopeptide (TPR) repeat protein